MQPISTKLSVGTSVGASSATGASVVVIWLLGLIHVTVPPEVAAVLAVWLGAAVTMVAGYMQRELNLPTEPPAP